MTEFVSLVIESINNISVQVEGLADVAVEPDMMILGEGSFFDSFAILLLLVELEQGINSDLLKGRSLVEWFSTLDFIDNRDMTLTQFTELLFNNYLKA